MAKQNNKGVIKRIIGAVIDVKFEGELPKILNGLKCKHNGKDLIMEVAQHIGENTVRCIAMDSTDGLTRGVEIEDTGSSIKVPVGREVLGRIMNVVGEPIDERGPIKAKEYYPIHNEAPSLEDQSTASEVLITGIKVIDLLAPYAKGGKIGL
ncbi:UNVERIFIED_CONTAM: hypothetical protein GTU68_015510, partial [Idotea baltica]|nr:hypothetical protein [Idotea baltica]